MQKDQYMDVFQELSDDGESTIWSNFKSHTQYFKRWTNLATIDEIAAKKVPLGLSK